MNENEARAVVTAGALGVWVPRYILAACDGDWTAAAMVAQVVYWHTPTNDGRSRLAVVHGGIFWLARRHDQWFDDLMISDDQAKRAAAKVRELGLVIVVYHLFAGKRTAHYRPDWLTLAAAMGAPTGQRESAPTGGGDFAPTDQGESAPANTKTSTKTTTKRKTIAPAAPAPAPSTLYGDLFVAICKACRFDPKLLAPGDARNVSALAKRLAASDVQVAEVEVGAARWAAEDWRGKNGQAPTVSQFASWLSTCRTTDPVLKVGANPPREHTRATPEAYQLIRDTLERGRANNAALARGEEVRRG